MEGEGATTGVVAINGHWGRRLKAFKGARVMGKE
jgi:hypothetical protein